MRIDCRPTMSKLNVTQNTIRNKFNEIHANRLEHEHDVQQTLKPLEADEPKSSSDISELQPQLRVSHQFRLIESRDPNILCDELRVMLSAPHASSKQAIDAILRELRSLDIIL